MTSQRLVRALPFDFYTLSRLLRRHCCSSSFGMTNRTVMQRQRCVGVPLLLDWTMTVYKLGIVLGHCSSANTIMTLSVVVVVVDRYAGVGVVLGAAGELLAAGCTRKKRPWYLAMLLLHCHAWLARTRRRTRRRKTATLLTSSQIEF